MPSYTTVTTPEGREITIGWDMCGTCHRHESHCRCEGGATPPKWVTAEHQSGVITYGTDDGVDEPVQRFVIPEGFRKPERDPLTGRKIRRDKGVKRGPRQSPANN